MTKPKTSEKIKGAPGKLIWRAQRSQWFVQLFVDGKKKLKTTGTGDKREAHRVAPGIVAELMATVER